MSGNKLFSDSCISLSDLGEAPVRTVLLPCTCSGAEEVRSTGLEHSLRLQRVRPAHQHQAASGIHVKSNQLKSNSPHRAQQSVNGPPSARRNSVAITNMIFCFSCLWMITTRCPSRPSSIWPGSATTAAVWQTTGTGAFWWPFWRTSTTRTSSRTLTTLSHLVEITLPRQHRTIMATSSSCR